MLTAIVPVCGISPFAHGDDGTCLCAVYCVVLCFRLYVAHLYAVESDVALRCAV